jgi:hypothetical protein
MGKGFNKKYLKYSLAFKQSESEFRDRLMVMLPDEIIDCHAHCNLQKHASFDDPIILGHPASTFSGFSLETSKKTQKIFYPGKIVRTLRFPIPVSGVNFKEANNYLILKSSGLDRVAVCGIFSDVEYTTMIVRNKKVAALKMYSYSICPPAEKIYQFFKPEILEVAEQLDLPIILHLPLFMDQSIGDLLAVLKDFPRLRVALAHLGNPNFAASGLLDLYKKIVRYENIYLDTALVSHWRIIESAFKVFGFKRIMFGSDEPLNMLRTTEYNNPKFGPRLVTEYPYHWVNKEEHEQFKHLAQNAVHLHWLSLQMLLDVIQKNYRSNLEDAIKSIFHDNAEEFFSF